MNNKVSNAGEYDNGDSVEKTLNSELHCSGPIHEARMKQDKMLKDMLLGKNLCVADIGPGDGHHGVWFGKDCKCYHGFEISNKMANICEKVWDTPELLNNKIFHCDASTVELKDIFYDIVHCSWFGSGNFRNPNLKLEEYDDNYLNHNPEFQAIISNFYKALKIAGHMFLCVYKDKPLTEEEQWKFYESTGQTIITKKGSRFVATKEDFWSVRWTKESMLSNLSDCGIQSNQVKFNDLSEVAWYVEITK